MAYHDDLNQGLRILNGRHPPELLAVLASFRRIDMLLTREKFGISDDPSRCDVEAGADDVRRRYEDRYIAGQKIYLSINYSYNLAGQLNGLTDPFGASFTYTRDAVGQLKTLIGSPYGGFSNYINNVNYRASGKPKSVTFSSYTATIAYTPRMQPAQFRGIIREDYAYWADGKIESITDLDDTAGSNPPVSLRFLSRAYRYDHAGRVQNVFGTGNAGQGVPFNQSYSYDHFGNVTQRSGKYYNYNFSAPLVDTATYSNNRRSNWSYNADGQVISTPATSTDLARTMTHDAAGRLLTTVETGPLNTKTYSAAYDGDGKLVRETSTTLPGASQTEETLPQTPCHIMADIAQILATDAVRMNGNPDDILKQFDHQFSTLYHGPPSTSFANMKEAQRLNNKGLGRTIPHRYIGGDGFLEKYKDSDPTIPSDPYLQGPKADQTHHFSAHLSLGINRRMFTNAIRNLLDNQGDANIVQAAYEIGRKLRGAADRGNVSALNNIGEYIKKNICSSHGRGLSPGQWDRFSLRL